VFDLAKTRVELATVCCRKQGGQVALSVSVANGPADIASQVAPSDLRALWFSVVGGSAALLVWHLWGWIFKKMGIS